MLNFTSSLRSNMLAMQNIDLKFLTIGCGILLLLVSMGLAGATGDCGRALTTSSFFFLKHPQTMVHSLKNDCSSTSAASFKSAELCFFPLGGVARLCYYSEFLPDLSTRSPYLYP